MTLGNNLYAVQPWRGAGHSVQGAGPSEYRAFCERRERTSSDEFSETCNDIGDETPTPPTLCLWLNGFVIRWL